MSNRGNDALTHALIETNAATALLENQRPTMREIEDAAEHLDSARRSLKAALTLIELGIYTVAPAPETGTPLPGLEA